jgi:hypothetical protein
MTNPAVVAYDPAYAYEIGHIVRDGLRRMYGESPEDVFYYITVYNEPYVQPAQPEGLDAEGVLRGMYLLAPATAEHERRAQILASGVAVPWALKAQRLLAEEWGVAADVWSVTSWTELRRDGLAVDRHNLFSPTEEPRRAYVTERLADRPGPVVAVSDYMNALQDMIRPWVPGDFATLGTDGTSWSTPSRSCAGRCCRWPSAARSTARSCATRWTATGCGTRPRRTPATPRAAGDRARPGRWAPRRGHPGAPGWPRGPSGGCRGRARDRRGDAGGGRGRVWALRGQRHLGRRGAGRARHALG